MKLSWYIHTIGIVCIVFSSLCINGMGVSYEKPTILVGWSDQALQTYERMSSVYLKRFPFFCIYNKKYLDLFCIPSVIPVRNSKDPLVRAEQVNDLLEKLLDELKMGRKSFTDFTVLKDANFSYKVGAGALILKSNEYPLVIKLFIENPHTFVRPLSKGIESLFFFLQGGANRHLTGFTRIENCNYVAQKVAASMIWNGRLQLPRKWFWTPSSVRGLRVIGYNFSAEQESPLEIVLPETYAIITDFMEGKPLSIFDWRETRRVLELFNYLKLCVDPNTENVLVHECSNRSECNICKTGEKKFAANTGDSTGNSVYILIDTEHFPTLLGINKPMPPLKNYIHYYYSMIKNCIKNFIQPLLASS